MEGKWGWNGREEKREGRYGKRKGRRKRKGRLGVNGLSHRFENLVPPLIIIHHQQQ